MKTRRGHSLVECVIAIGLIGATFTTVAVAMSGMYRTSRRVCRAAGTELDLERFAAQLRGDAHQSLSVKEDIVTSPSGDAKTLSLTLTSERSVYYTLREGHVERVLRRGDALQHRETYRLSGAFTARWFVDRDRARPMVSLILEAGAAGASSPLGFQAMRIDAAVGLLRPLPAPSQS
jgi:type II secretory pathway pseudopilin PulG